MNKYINQDKVIDAVLNLDTSNRVSWRDAVVDMIDAMPSEDVQPVVHCKDCKHYNGKFCFNGNATAPKAPNANDFCSWGERRTEDETD